MTRFTERVERDLGQIADRATPSSTAWEAIQQRIAEQDTTESTSEVIMLAPDRNEPPARTRTWILVAAAIVVLALIGGLIVAGTRSDEDQVPVDEPEVEIEEGGAEPLPPAGSDVDPGLYETDLLGLPLMFNVPETMNLWTATQNRVLLTDVFDTTVSPPPATARTLSFSRISGWNTPEEAVDLEYVGPGSIDPDDIDAWAAANDLDASIPPCCHTVVSGDEVPERVPTRLARRDATPLDVRIDPARTTPTFECGEGVTCAWAASVSDRGTDARFGRDPLLVAGQVNRFWVIHLDGQDPLLLHASASESDEAWLDLVDDTVLFDESLPVAEPAPEEEAEPAVPEVEAAPTFPTGTAPGDVLFDGTNIWVTNGQDDTVSRFDPTDGSRVDFETRFFPDSLAFDGTNLWILNVDETVSSMDPVDGTREDYEFAIAPTDVFFDGTSIWVGLADEQTETYALSQVDPADGTRVDYETDAWVDALAFDGTSLWAATDENTVARLDPTGGTEVEYEIIGTPRDFLFAAGSLWILYWDAGDVVSRIDPGDGTRVEFATGGEPAQMTFDGTSLWITNRLDNTVSQMNTDDGSRVEYPTGNIPAGVAFDGAYIWVANSTDYTLSKITPE